MFAVGLTTLTNHCDAADWKPADGVLTTRWTKSVAPATAHQEYPRPQLVRSDWRNLNGLWDYAIRPKAEGRPDSFDGRILVPFPIESALSGVRRTVGEANRLWYRTTFVVPSGWTGRRVLLHFGAVDWETTVWLNDKEVGSHRGGYDPFSIDITGALNPHRDQQLVVGVWDPSDAGTQPRGKQVRKPHGIWYTPTTGIWQTVWLEPVPQTHIVGLKTVPDVDGRKVRIAARCAGSAEKLALEAVVVDPMDQSQTAAAKEPVKDNSATVEIALESPKLWSPDRPFLYDLQVRLMDGAHVVDRVKSYFGMRKISLGKDDSGVTRIMLNNRPIFMFGPLDQGFWPDGLYTAPSDEALRYDIEVTKRLGFNMARKHVKIEPDRWYYWCDKLGLLVWQDMPNGDAHVAPGKGEIKREAESARQFEAELKALIDACSNHPSIVMWVVFNEGWGQYDTARLTKWVAEYDPTRLVNGASGWNDMKVGAVNDIHSYPGPAAPAAEPARAIVLGEFGGLGLPLEGHTWQAKENWGYRTFTTRAELTKAYMDLLEKLKPMTRSPGLSAAVYTQTTDVEIEVNGLLTYDRAVIKMPTQTIADANRAVYPK
jgi:beta-galactosidase/beta-glucuronidase